MIVSGHKCWCVKARSHPWTVEGCEATKVSKPSLSWQMSEPDLHTLKVHTELSDPVLCNRSAVSAAI